MTDFISTINWLFIIKLVLLYTFWLLVSKIYKSKWLWLNKKEYEPNLSDFPSFIKPFAKNFFNEGILFTVFSVLFGLLGLLGVITLSLIFWDGLKAFEHRLSVRSMWFQMGACMGLIVAFYIFHGYLTNKFKDK